LKNKSIAITILLITIITYLLLAFVPIKSNNSYAADMQKGTLSRDIDALDDNLYPGYKQLIKTLQANHSNYVFLLYYTGLDWSEVLTAEYQGHGSGNSPKNLFQIGNSYNGMWVCPLCGTEKYDNGSWCCSSLEALSYMMDPRNSINESDVFQFKDLNGSDVTYDDIAKAVSSYGSYINNQEAIQAIVDASNQYNINGYFLVAKIINEHGKNGSTLSNGGGYNGKYVGVYNYFNIGSSGNGSDKIINSGLAYAQQQGWTSIRASILGGTAVVKNSYIDEHNQNTFYYQKFNVSGRDTLASHQYQQNIMAAQSQGTSMKSYYANSGTSGVYTFIIPLYKNMPSTACARPDTTKTNSISYEDGIVQHVTTSLTVRASQSLSGVAIGKLNNNESIKILKRATSQVDGYYWDLIVSNADGTYGYAARYVGGEQCIVGKGSTATSSGSASTSSSETPTTSETTTTQPTGGTTNLDSSIKVSGDYINTLPDITCENIKTKYESATIKDRNGADVTSGKLGTGYKVTVDGKTYTVVKKGDVNGDAVVSILDAVAMLNSVKGNNVLQNEYRKAAAVKNNDDFNITDIVLLLNIIKGTANLSL
jgi:beta-N-acetylglucosaminidase